MEEKISMNESIQAGAPDIKYSGGDIRMGGQETKRSKHANCGRNMVTNGARTKSSVSKF